MSSSPAFGPLTCTPVSGTLAAPGLAVLQGVTATAHPGYDALVFTFASLSASPVPPGVSATYQVAPDSPPFTADPSGKPLAVMGSSFLKIAFHGAYGYDPVNVPPQASYHGPTDLTPRLTTLVEAREAGDFEGYLTWIVGLSRQACWRVVRAAGPPTFELDVPA